MTDRKTLCDFWAGACCGMVESVIGHPLETIKVRMHIFGDQGIRATARNVRHLQGFTGFYKGFNVVAVNGTVNTAMCLGLYSMLHKEFFYRTSELACCEHGNPGPYLHLKLFVCGFISSMVNVAWSCPIELIKTRLQLHGINHNITPLKTFVLVYNAKGRQSLKNFYLGVGPMCLKDCPAFGSFVVVQEHMECYLRQQVSIFPSLIVSLLSGGAAGITYAMVGYPFDVIKSRMMTDRLDRPVYRGMVHCFKKTRKENGLKIFLHGGLPAVVRGFLVGAIGLTVFKEIHSICFFNEYKYWK